MRVTFNSFRDESLTQLNRELSQQARLQGQISSGQKISRADEDPATAERILGLQSVSAQAQQHYQTAGYALAISRSSYNAMDQVRQVSDRAGELVSGVSELTTPDTFARHSVELDGLLEQALAAANQQFDGKYLMGGTKTDSAPFAVARDAEGKVSSVTYVGAATGPEMQVADGVTVKPYTDNESNEDVGVFINRLIALRDAFRSADAGAVQAQRPALTESEDAVLGSLGRIGVTQRRLEISQESATTRFDEASSRISTYNDVDLPRAIVELTRSQTAYQAALQTTANIMSKSLLDYL
jgi:flagellar hook-associated protein 3 FlgL